MERWEAHENAQQSRHAAEQTQNQREAERLLSEERAARRDAMERFSKAHSEKTELEQKLEAVQRANAAPKKNRPDLQVENLHANYQNKLRDIQLKLDEASRIAKVKRQRPYLTKPGRRFDAEGGAEVRDEPNTSGKV